MNDIISLVFGEGKDLNALQMGSRTFVMFFITLGLIRLAGMRAFGQKSAFDAIIVIMLGAILSRAVAGASPFFPTVVAGAVLALVHRVVAMLTVHSKALGAIFKGKKALLFTDGKTLNQNMRRCNISLDDLMEEIRINLNESTLENVQDIFMERSGKISVVKKLF